MEETSVFRKLEKTFFGLTKAIAVVLLALMVVVVFSNVISRYFLNASLAWSEEISRFMFIWLVFLGAVLAYVKDEHLGLDILVNSVPKRVAYLILVIADVLVLYAIYLLTAGGYDLMMQSIGWTSPATSTPYSIVYAAVPVSGFILFVQTIFKLVKSIKNLINNN